MSHQEKKKDSMSQSDPCGKTLKSITEMGKAALIMWNIKWHVVWHVSAGEVFDEGNPFASEFIQW